MEADIVSNLHRGQHTNDGPDLVAHFFHAKLMELLDDIIVNHVLVVLVDHLYVIEFSNWVLPPAHMLFILQSDDKLH